MKAQKRMEEESELKLLMLGDVVIYMGVWYFHNYLYCVLYTLVNVWNFPKYKFFPPKVAEPRFKSMPVSFQS